MIELLETILFYKFPKLSRQEIEAMFELSALRQTRVYQEAVEEGKVEGKVEGKLEGKVEGKLETVPLLMKLGLDVDQIAAQLDLDIESVRKASRS